MDNYIPYSPYDDMFKQYITMRTYSMWIASRHETMKHKKRKKK